MKLRVPNWFLVLACAGAVWPACDTPSTTTPPLEPAPAPLRRLTNREYDFTVRDLLGDTSRLAQSFAPDERIGGFASNAIAGVAYSQVDDYLEAAETLAEQTIAERMGVLIACNVAERPCVESFVDGFGLRAHRRPVDAEARTAYLALYDGAGTPEEGLRLILEAMLMSPEFLYHVEASAPQPGEAAVLLDDYEMAARLSYFLWSSMPDEALFAAAAAGELRDPATLETHVRRMLDDPRAVDGIDAFTDQWLSIDGLETISKLVDGWTQDVAGALRADALAFARATMQGADPTFHALLTAPLPPADPLVQTFYGPREQGRNGILASGAFLAAHAHADAVSWVQRGRFVREHLLCDIIPSPPPDVDMTVPLDPNRATNPSCAPCHQLMDPIGIGFDGFDATGGFLGTNVAGEVVSAAGDDATIIGPFVGVAELEGKLASSNQVMTCFTDHAMRYALGRIPSETDPSSLASVAGAFSNAGGNLRELFVAIAMSPAFRHKSAPTTGQTP